MQKIKQVLGGGKKDKDDASHTDDVSRQSVARTSVTSATSRGTSIDRAEPVVGDAHEKVAVGLPQAGVATASATYTDAKIESRDKTLPVTDIAEERAIGQNIGMKEEVISVPVTTMQKKIVEVPEVVMEPYMETKPVTVTRKVPEIVHDVEMRTEEVTREEVVVDKVLVEQPTTVMKPVVTEKPKFVEAPKFVATLEERLQKVKVVRPRIHEERVKVLRPVEVKKVVTVKKPVVRMRKAPVQSPVQKTELVNITQPYVEGYTAEVQVPYTEERHVEYQKPVTVIKDANLGVVAEDVAERDNHNLKEQIKEKAPGMERKRDLKEIPVGLPFTEMMTKFKNFNVTQLRSETQTARNTVMQPVQVESYSYTMADHEVELMELDWEEVQEEVIVTELQEFEDIVQVTTMDEVEEEWPVAKESQVEVLTSEVTLEPVAAEVPEIALQQVEVEQPRTITHVETIEKAVPVEREVLVEKPFTEMREVPAERPVEVMRPMEVEQPVTHYEQRTVMKPVTVEQEIVHETTMDRPQHFTEEVATHEQKAVQYTTAQGKMVPTAVPGDVAIDPAVDFAKVSEKDLAKATKELPRQPGVVAGAAVGPGHMPEMPSTDLGMTAAKEVAPHAILKGSVHSSLSLAPEDTAGHLVDPATVAPTATAGFVTPGVVVDQAHLSRKSSSSVSSSDVEATPATKHADGGPVPHEKKGLMAKMKNKIKQVM